MNPLLWVLSLFRSWRQVEIQPEDDYEYTVNDVLALSSGRVPLLWERSLDRARGTPYEAVIRDRMDLCSLDALKAVVDSLRREQQFSLFYRDSNVVE
jgi:hypothetical protein